MPSPIVGSTWPLRFSDAGGCQAGLGLVLLEVSDDSDGTFGFDAILFAKTIAPITKKKPENSHAISDAAAAIGFSLL